MVRTFWQRKQKEIMVLQAAGVSRGRSQHRKQEWDRRYHEPKTSPEQLDRLLKLHPDEVKKCESWNAGAKDASHFAEKLGLRRNVPLAAWTDPWTYMKEKLHVDEVTKRPRASNDVETVCPDDHSPPVDLIHSALDVRVTIIQLICRKIDPQDLDPDLPNNIRKNRVEPRHQWTSQLELSYSDKQLCLQLRQIITK